MLQFDEVKAELSDLLQQAKQLAQDAQAFDQPVPDFSDLDTLDVRRLLDCLGATSMLHDLVCRSCSNRTQMASALLPTYHLPGTLHPITASMRAHKNHAADRARHRPLSLTVLTHPPSPWHAGGRQHDSHGVDAVQGLC